MAAAAGDPETTCIAAGSAARRAGGRDGTSASAALRPQQTHDSSIKIPRTKEGLGSILLLSICSSRELGSEGWHRCCGNIDRGSHVTTACPRQGSKPDSEMTAQAILRPVGLRVSRARRAARGTTEKPEPRNHSDCTWYLGRCYITFSNVI